MAASLYPKINILPSAQQEIWPLLAPASALSFVLYGGTAVASISAIELPWTSISSRPHRSIRTSLKAVSRL